MALNGPIYFVNMMVTVLKTYLMFVPLEEKKSATVPKPIKEFLKNKK